MRALWITLQTAKPTIIPRRCEAPTRLSNSVEVGCRCNMQRWDTPLRANQGAERLDAEKTVSEAKVTRRLVAILAADVVGYSRMMEADEAGTLTKLKTHRRELWNPATEQYGGRIVGTAGDSLLVEFVSTVAAVECAARVQKEMSDRNADLSESERMQLRIGVNIGEVIVDDDDIYGEGVNIAARLEALCEPGGVAVSDDAHRQIGGKTDLAFVDAGEYQVKNIAKPVRLWRWVQTNAPAAAATRNAASCLCRASPP